MKRLDDRGVESHSETRIQIEGMDCADCARSVSDALERHPGVVSARVSFTAEHATVRYDPHDVTPDELRSVIRTTGYTPVTARERDVETDPDRAGSLIFRIFGLVVGIILVIVVLGEMFGLLDRVTERVPWYLWLAGIGIGGYPVFRNVFNATRQRRIIAHSLMTVGVAAAIAVGEWPTAAVVVVFMRIGEYVEGFTARGARGALRDLTSAVPREAVLERDGQEITVPVESLTPGDIVLVRPGERIPADGEVVSGSAFINQASITGESMPAETGPGDKVYASTIPEHGAIRVEVSAIGEDTTFGRIIQFVEEAESQRGTAQRIADRFATWFLPFVIGVAALTLIFRQDPLAMTAVLVVACSCSFALATPIAILASVGSAAKRGLLVKGGRYLEALAAADVILLDKTGTLTYGLPAVTDVVQVSDVPADRLVRLAGLAEYASEHPVANAIRQYARALGVTLHQADRFEAIPGAGVRAAVDDQVITVGNASLIEDGQFLERIQSLEATGKTVVQVAIDGRVAGLIAVADEIRPDAIQAVERLKQLGFTNIEMLTGDNERVAAGIASRLGIGFRAGLLPEDKIAVVRMYQEQGLRTVMIGDGVNDAPALAQADAGIALGAAGSDVAIEVAPVSLMRDDWRAVPELFEIARRTVRVIRLNIGFTAAYNMIGLSLAAFGYLPPVIAAAAQSIPDVGILANSSRLLRHAGGDTADVPPQRHTEPTESRPVA